MDADSAATRGGRHPPGHPQGEAGECHPPGHPQGAAGEADYCKALIVRKVHQPQARLSTSNSGLVCRLVAAVRWGWSSAPVPRTRKVSNFLLLHLLCPTQIICHQQTNIPGPALSLKTPKKLNHALRGCDDVLHCLLLDIFIYILGHLHQNSSFVPFCVSPCKFFTQARKYSGPRTLFVPGIFRPQLLSK